MRSYSNDPENQVELSAIGRRRIRRRNLRRKNEYEIQQELNSREDRVLSRRWYYLGVGLVLIGIIFRQPLFIVLGVLVLLVLGITDIWATYCLHDIRYKRELSERRVLFGEEITLSLSVENAKMLPLPWLEAQDIMPRTLNIKGYKFRAISFSNTATLDCLFSPRWYDRVTRRYTIQCNTRGVHTFGPTVIRSGDVFGFVTREAELSSRQYLLVYPLVVPLTRFGLPARHPFGDRRVPPRLLEDPSRVVGVRDYTYGDSLRRVNWKATARTLQMQSKVYEATTTYTLALFLNASNPRLDTYYGVHPELQELAICAAASLTNWAAEQRYAVGLYANSTMFLPDEEQASVQGIGQEQPEGQRPEGLEATIAAQLNRRRIRVPTSNNETQRQRIMEVLARIQPYFGTSIEDVIQAERTHLPAGSTVVVITSNISDYLLDTLARVRQGGHTVSILFVGDSPLPIKVAGVTIYHIGGEDTWKQFEATYSAPSNGETHVVENSPGLQL